MFTLITAAIGTAFAAYALCEMVSQIRGLVREMRKN